MSRLWGQQRVPRVVADGMYSTTARDVGMGGTTSVHWLHWLGNAIVVAQRAWPMTAHRACGAGCVAIFFAS